MKTQKLRVRRRVTVPVVAALTRTKQEFRKEVDINTIIAKMRRGILPNGVTLGEQQFADLTRVPTNFQDAFDQVSRAREAFELLPLDLRKEVDHDPRRLFGPEARGLFEKHGLLKAPKASGSAATTEGDPQPKGGSASSGKAPGSPAKASKAGSQDPASSAE